MRGYIGDVSYRMLPSSGAVWSDVVAYWKLDGNANDASGNGHNGSLVGSPTLVSGRENGAYLFNGSNQYVETTTLGNFGSQNLSEFSAAFWMKTAVTDTIMSVMGFVNDGTTVSFEIDINSGSTGSVAAGSIRMFLRDSSGAVAGRIYQAAEGAGVSDGIWHHVVTTLKASTGTVQVYVDGVSKAMTVQYSGTGTYANLQYPLYLGGNNGRGSLGGAFSGTLDEVAIIKRVVNQDEVTRMYNDVTKSGLWNLDEHYHSRRRGEL